MASACLRSALFLQPWTAVMPQACPRTKAMAWSRQVWASQYEGWKHVQAAKWVRKSFWALHCQPEARGQHPGLPQGIARGQPSQVADKPFYLGVDGVVLMIRTHHPLAVPPQVVHRIEVGAQGKRTLLV